jgi:hypothetical protein
MTKENGILVGFRKEEASEVAPKSLTMLWEQKRAFHGDQGA